MVIKYKASNLIADFNLNAKTALTTLSELLGTKLKSRLSSQKNRLM